MKRERFSSGCVIDIPGGLLSCPPNLPPPRPRLAAGVVGVHFFLLLILLFPQTASQALIQRHWLPHETPPTNAGPSLRVIPPLLRIRRLLLHPSSLSLFLSHSPFFSHSLRLSPSHGARFPPRSTLVRLRNSPRNDYFSSVTLRLTCSWKSSKIKRSINERGRNGREIEIARLIIENLVSYPLGD